MKTPDCMKNNPLSDKDVQLIADYCKEKRTSLFQYLLNEMKFDLKVVYNNKTYTVSEISKDPILKMHLVVGSNFTGEGWAYNYGPINGSKNIEHSQKIYLATGKQYITQNDKRARPTAWACTPIPTGTTRRASTRPATAPARMKRYRS